MDGDQAAAKASAVIPVESAPPAQGPDGSAVLPEPRVSPHWERHRVRLPVLPEKTVVQADRVMAWFWNNPYAFAFLVMLGVVSMVWGYVSFYGPQYPGVPWYLWVFVPDSPFALTLWLAAAFAVRTGWDRRPGALGALFAFIATWAAAINIKIGLWTPFILLFYSDVFFAGTLFKQMFQGLLLLAHVGMVAFGLLLIRKMRALPAMAYVSVLALLFLWDFMDYFFVEIFLSGSGVTIYPLGIPPDPARLYLTMGVTMGISVLSALGVWWGIRLRGPPSPR